MRNFSWVFAVLSLVGFVAASNPNENYFAEVRQDENHVGVLGLIDQDTGKVVKEAPVTFTFSWPYVEMTSNTKDKKIYITTFPDNSSNAELYQYNSNLEFEHAWPDTDFWFFDLQYLSSQNTLYGIKVTSSYGRTLSRFDAVPTQTTVNATELFTLPYMWYVNASTVDQTTNRYFGLINYFPGHPESVLDQQLVNCDFTSGTGEQCKVIAVDNSLGIVHFISYGMRVKELFAAVIQEDEVKTTISLATLDADTGKLHKLWSTSFPASHDAPYLLLGPLVYSEVESALSFFLRERATDAWQLWKLPVRPPHIEFAEKVSTFNKVNTFNMFSGATKFST